MTLRPTLVLVRPSAIGVCLENFTSFRLYLGKPILYLPRRSILIRSIIFGDATFCERFRLHDGSAFATVSAVWSFQAPSCTTTENPHSSSSRQLSLSAGFRSLR